MSSRSGHTGRAVKPVVLCLVVLVIAGSIGVGLFDRGKHEPGPVSIFVPDAVTLAPGLHLLGALAPSVAYVIETSEGLIMVDAGLEDGFEAVLRQFEALGLDIQDLQMILVTHGHGDHYLGAMNLQQLTGARIHAGAGDSDILRNAGPREAVFSTFPMDHVHIHPTAVDVELIGGETIELGDVRIQVIATPGHTPGSVCYLMERGDQTALFSGDTIMTITGDLGTYSTYLPPRYRGDARNYLATLRKLREIPVPNLLLPGHPRTDLGMVSARVTPEEWSSLLNRGIRQMEELTARYEVDGADFLDGNPKELISGLYYLGDFSGISIYCFADQSSLILIDAPGGKEYLSFLERQLGDIGHDLAMLKAVVLTESGPDWTAGLPELIDRTGCQVIASSPDVEFVQNMIPDATVLFAEATVSEYPWFPLQPVSVAGFSRTRTAYRIEWAGKRILLSGRVPLLSLSRVQEIQPDLWLPAVPVHGQNANLYGNDWTNILYESR